MPCKGIGHRFEPGTLHFCFIHGEAQRRKMTASDASQDPGEPESGALAAPPKEKRKPQPAPPKVEKLPPFKVILHNDAVNTMDHVIRTIVQLPPLTLEVAVRRMLEAHTQGRSLLLTTHKERAELYREQFKSRKLKVTIEAT